MRPCIEVRQTVVSDLVPIDEPGYVCCREGAATETGDVDGVARLVVRLEPRHLGPALWGH